MRSFTLSSTGNARSYLPCCSYTVSENSTISVRLRRIFKGPCPATPEPQWKDEKPYHHVPTHARASFMKTATNPSMNGPQLKNATKASTLNEKTENRHSIVQESLI